MDGAHDPITFGGELLIVLSAVPGDDDDIPNTGLKQTVNRFFNNGLCTQSQESLRYIAAFRAQAGTHAGGQNDSGLNHPLSERTAQCCAERLQILHFDFTHVRDAKHLVRVLTLAPVNHKACRLKLIVQLGVAFIFRQII